MLRNARLGCVCVKKSEKISKKVLTKGEVFAIISKLSAREHSENAEAGS